MAVPNMFDRLTFEPYEFKEFPKMLYGKGGKTTVVQSQEGIEKLRGEWFTTPGEALPQPLPENEE